MKAIVIHGKRDLRVEEFATDAVGANDVKIAVATGGICGSDLHYFNHGGFGAVRLREPMALGHEVAGYVREIGADVRHVAVGDLVAVLPSRPCWNCEYCHKGMPNFCLNMRFYGSAMPFPHIQGAFREEIVVGEAQCVLADGLTPAEAAMAEPLSVVLHAALQAGNLLGKRVLVTGCGPIGLLAVMVSKLGGAEFVAATDLTDFSLGFAQNCGADAVINVAQNPEGLEKFKAERQKFDVLFECTGSNPALVSALHVMRPRGILVQLGLGGDMQIPMSMITTREFQIRGSFRFHEEFSLAVKFMQSGQIDVKPLITQSYDFHEAEAAFLMAGDRNQAIKTQLNFSKQ